MTNINKMDPFVTQMRSKLCQLRIQGSQMRVYIIQWISFK